MPSPLNSYRLGGFLLIIKSHCIWYMASCSHLNQFTKDGVPVYRKICAWFICPATKKTRRAKVRHFAIFRYYILLNCSLWSCVKLAVFFRSLVVSKLSSMWHDLKSFTCLLTLYLFWMLFWAQTHPFSLKARRTQARWRKSTMARFFSKSWWI